jgi:hypothetical protein
MSIEPVTAVVDYYTPSLRRKYGLNSDRITDQSTVQRSADIDWVPDWDKYVQRVRSRPESTGSEDNVPEGWPSRIHHPLAWSGKELHEGDYIFQIETKHKWEIDNALEFCQGMYKAVP